METSHNIIRQEVTLSCLYVSVYLQDYSVLHLSHNRLLKNSQYTVENMVVVTEVVGQF